MGDGLGRSSGLRHYRHPSSRRARAVISSAAGPLQGVDASLPGAPTAADQSAIFGAQAAPKFYKLEFPTYDGSVDPLNWLNQCEQFFRGQQTMASQRTWLASYHMKGAAQTWYYALEQDEGMPHWERFRELCSLRFGPAVQGTRLAELARLPFLSTVQDYSERYNAVLCHARDLSPRQKAELYVGGLPEQIKVHVEMRTPPDLQSAMYLARAFERCVAVPAPPAPQRGNRPQRQGLPPLPRAPGAAPVPGGVLPPPAVGPAAANAPAAHPFRRLTPAEMAERRRQGLCFNCDEPYVRGHVCQRLFYVECDDFIDDIAADDAAAAAVHLEEPAAPELAGANAFVVSLHAVAGIRPANSMLVPVTIKGERFLALLDTGSTHNFLQGAAMRRLGLSPSGGEDLRVTVANGDRLACAGIARAVPIRIADEDFIITCVGLDLGGFDFILGFDFLRTLGPILWDCTALTMAFWRDGRRVTWQGVGGSATPTDQQRSATAAVTADPALPLLDSLLQQHGAIFDEPRGLPPARPYDHRIHLLPGTASLAVRPYRYPQLQKDELER